MRKFIYTMISIMIIIPVLFIRSKIYEWFYNDVTVSVYETESAIESGIKYYDIDSFLKGINSINNIYGNGLTYNSSDFFEFCDVITLLTGDVKR